MKQPFTLKIKDLPRGPKEWWRLNLTLLGRGSKTHVSIPPLSNAKKRWVLEGAEQTDLFGDTFAAKCKLPEKKGLVS